MILYTLREFGFASERPLGDLRVRIVVGMGSACSGGPGCAGLTRRRRWIDSFATGNTLRERLVFRDLCMGFGFVWLYNPVSMIGPVRISVWGLDFFGFSILGMDF